MVGEEEGGGGRANSRGWLTHFRPRVWRNAANASSRTSLSRAVPSFFSGNIFYCRLSPGSRNFPLEMMLHASSSRTISPSPSGRPSVCLSASLSCATLRASRAPRRATYRAADVATPTATTQQFHCFSSCLSGSFLPTRDFIIRFRLARSRALSLGNRDARPSGSTRATRTPI